MEECSGGKFNQLPELFSLQLIPIKFIPAKAKAVQAEKCGNRQS